jgi:hypothetical protein
MPIQLLQTLYIPMHHIHRARTKLLPPPPLLLLLLLLLLQGFAV